ncbi:DNA mismatch repair protein MutS [Bacteroidetes/Chlorobi group bacterium Naka2016]|jgi:DNA mismatch repair protein MutS|nr:MAG: DNA mismatch repair protein MutS [Bacteroidetes/Chlorobi group bacterium Naka2016]
MKDLNTPLIKQYLQIKSKYPDYILLYRIGDFYETFFEDAEITSKVCNIILTKRNNGAAGDVPLAGFPFHQLDNYLPKIVKAGYKVAVCEQVEDPKKAKGIVRREVIEVVTPGIALNERLLPDRANNFISALYLQTNNIQKDKVLGIAFADVSTGEFFVTEIFSSKLIDFLGNYNIREIIISKSQKQLFENVLQNFNSQVFVNKLEPWIFDYQFAKEGLLGHFGTTNLKGFGIDKSETAVVAAGALLYHIKQTQPAFLAQIKQVRLLNLSNFMTLDLATKRNLEIYTSLDNLYEGGLYSVLDKTLTPMGARLLKRWVGNPLLDKEQIVRRLDLVQMFYENSELRSKIRNHLNEVADIERLTSKICSFKATPRDVLALKKSLDAIPLIITELGTNSNPILGSLINKLYTFDEIRDLIQKSIREDASVTVGSGDVIKKGYNTEFDKLKDFATNSKNYLKEYQEEEKIKTNIPSLKIGFNNVFGYYIEVTKVHSNKVPNYFERKQTLTNAERYTTPKLKEIEEKLLNIEFEIQQIEINLFNDILSIISNYTNQLQSTAQTIAEIDCLVNFATVAQENNYCKPIITDDFELEIKNGRHPVVEKNLPIGEKFTPNSTFMNKNSFVHIITGPNMSGKSCYLRQVGLIVLLAQIGSFVPADYAKIGIVDRIFTRVGAQDNISQGESTFLVEMQESANILNNATSRSLILLDEVGRGTATFDGISIAWAIAEYIHNNIGAKTLFATHYHELNELENKYENIENYCVEVIEKENKVIFTHKLKKGHSDHSFGIYVAQMAGIPEEVINRANEILRILENSATTQRDIFAFTKPNPKMINTIERKHTARQLAIFDFSDDELKEKILSLDLNNLTPVQALAFLENLQKELREKG